MKKSGMRNSTIDFFVLGRILNWSHNTEFLRVNLCIPCASKQLEVVAKQLVNTDDAAGSVH